VLKQMEDSDSAHVVLYDYEAVENDELSLTKGGKVVVLSKRTSNFGWFRCRDYETGKEGIVPGNYLSQGEVSTADNGEGDEDGSKNKSNDFVSENNDKDGESDEKRNLSLPLFLSQRIKEPPAPEMTSFKEVKSTTGSNKGVFPSGEGHAEHGEKNRDEEDGEATNVVLWSVTVPRVKSVSLAGVKSRDKQVCLMLDTVSREIQISEFPKNTESFSELAGAVESSARVSSYQRYRKISQEKPTTGPSSIAAKNSFSLGRRKRNVTRTGNTRPPTRISVEKNEWDKMFKTTEKEKEKRNSRWPLQFRFDQVSSFLRGGDCRTLTFCLVQEKDVTITFLTNEEREVFCMLLYYAAKEAKKRVNVTDEGEVWSDLPSLCVSYPVQTHKLIGAADKLLLKINFENVQLNVVWLRKRDTHLQSSRPLTITPAWQVERDTWNRQKLTLNVPSLEAPLVVTFPSCSLRERFCGHIRALIDRVVAVKSDNDGDCGKDEKLTISCCTFNAADTESEGPRKVQHLLGMNNSDIVVLVLEECKKKEQWMADILTAFKSGDGLRGNGYEMVATTTLWAIHIMVYAKADVKKHLSGIRTAEEATGMGGIMGNKGGVGVGFIYKDATRFCFIGSHLAARAKRMNERRQNFMDIAEKMKPLLLEKGTEFLHQYDYVFWAGDLNYRINILDGSGYDTELEFKTVLDMIKDKKFAELQTHDQLRREMEDGRVFYGFQEAPITFGPTYRMVRQCHDYSNKRFQAPSYTDRVLWKAKVGLEENVTCNNYSANFKLMQSDHRPVTAHFTVKTRRPYYNLVRTGNFYGSENCDLHFKSLNVILNLELIHAKKVESIVDEDDEDSNPLRSASKKDMQIVQLKQTRLKKMSSAEIGADKKKKKKKKGLKTKVKGVKKFLVKLIKRPKDMTAAKKSKKEGGRVKRKSIVDIALDTVGVGNKDKELYITMYAEFLETPLTSHVVTSNEVLKSTQLFVDWPDEGIPTVFPTVGEAKFIRQQHLFLVIRMRDEGASSGWHKVGHADIDLSQPDVSILEGSGRKVSVGASAKARTSFDNVKRMHAPLILHGINVGSISFLLQIRRVCALKEEDVGVGSFRLSNPLMKLATRQSLNSMMKSGKHKKVDLLLVDKNLKKAATSANGLVPSPAVENNAVTTKAHSLGHNRMHDIQLVVADSGSDDDEGENDDGEHHQEREAVSRRRIEQTNAPPPPPSFSLKEHRLSASLFHMKLPPPEPELPPPKFDSSLLPPPPPPSSI
jgi:hypothetical protein